MDIKLNPIFRETYTLGDVGVKEKGYYITDACVGISACAAVCRSRCPLRRARRTGFNRTIISIAGTAMRTVLRTRLSENEKK